MRSNTEINLVSLEHHSTRYVYQGRLKEKLEEKSTTGLKSTEEEYTILGNCIKKTARDAFRYKEKEIDWKPYWWDRDVGQKI